MPAAAIVDDPLARHWWGRLDTHGEYVAAHFARMPGGPSFVPAHSSGTCRTCGGRGSGWLIPVFDVADDVYFFLCWRCLKADGGR